MENHLDLMTQNVLNNFFSTNIKSKKSINTKKYNNKLNNKMCW